MSYRHDYDDALRGPEPRPMPGWVWAGAIAWALSGFVAAIILLAERLL